MLGKIEAWCIRRGLRKYLRTARQLPEASRQWMSRDIQERARVLMTRKSVDGSLTTAWLELQLAGDLTQRHLALRDGASSYSDPRWLQAAILVAWTILLIHETHGTLNPKQMRTVEEEIGSVFPFSWTPLAPWPEAVAGRAA
jgi:hypothetical protein